MDRLEMIEKLRERARVTYDEAREALEQANGDLLDALILLERQGKVPPPQGGGFYRSEGSAPTEQVSFERSDERTENGAGRKETSNFKESLERFWNFLNGLLKKGNTTSFEILKDKEYVASFPVTVLALLLVFAPWVTLPLIVIGLFLGFHYQFVRNDD